MFGREHFNAVRDAFPAELERLVRDCLNAPE